MLLPTSQPEQTAVSSSSLPLYRQVQHRLLALCILLAPLTVTIYLLSWINVRGSSLDYSRSIAELGAVTNHIHMILGILASIFLPLGYFGMALLGMRRAPWLATVAAIFSLVGWAPFAGIVSIDVLAYDVARAESVPQLIAL